MTHLPLFFLVGGALIGALLNKVLPELLLTVLLVLLLSFTAWESLKKAFKMYRKESEQFRELGLREDGTKESELTVVAQHEDDEQDDEAADGLLENAEKQGGGDGDEDDEEDEEGDQMKKKLVEDRQLRKELEDILEQERHVPTFNVGILGALFVVVLAVNLLKGGGAFKSPIGIRCGSRSFWMSNAFMIGWILLITMFIRAYLVRKHEAKIRCHFEFVEGDIQWDSRATIVYPVLCCAAGFL